MTDSPPTTGKVLNKVPGVDKPQVAAAFSAAARAYDEHAVLQRDVAGQMLERLRLVQLDPRRVLDAGSGTGSATRQLAARYKRAEMVSMDLAPAMLGYARGAAPRWFSRHRFVCADAEKLPFAADTFELVHSNLMLQWCNDLDHAFTEFHRVLNVDGLLLFSTFGPDTLKELRGAWQEVDQYSHVNTFIDMHDIGDALIRAGFSSPVLDVESYTLTYADLPSLMRDLKHIGAHNVTADRPRGLTGKQQFAQLQQAYEGFRDLDGRLPATYEVVYGHAWAPQPQARPQDGSTVAAFPIEQIPRRRTRA